ncbi:MAG TPA: NAD(P)-dependent alcohol dehydrogenase [Candidatus Baltobacteraceae bacterium]|nr:NAD(P)-dependent alcohol dehydrogenase [Candidatus Baltobacteraceae bacterium]
MSATTMRERPAAPPATMRAFVMQGLDNVGFATKPVPTPGPTDAIVKTTHALICSSDAHTVHGAIGPRENLTLGHEAVGIVSAVGSDVKLFKPGDRVVVGAITPTWGDLASQAGHSSQSDGALGGWKFANVKDGVFAEYFHVNEADANMALIPPSIPSEMAVYCADMLSTGFAGAENANIPIGGTVAIFAQGPVGLMATAGARLRGAGLIITVDAVPSRLQMSKHFGADVTIDLTKEDPVERILALTGGIGVDSAIEALGNPVSFANCIRVAKPGGTISNVGYHGHGDTVPIPREAWGVGMAEKTIKTDLCPGGRLRMQRLLTILQNGRVDPTPLTTHTFRFDQLEPAFEMMDKKTDGVIKPLILFS